MIAVEGRADLLSNLYQSLGGIEVANQIILLGKDRRELVPQPQVNGHLRSDAPVVLNECGESLVLQVHQEVPCSEPRPAHLAGEEVFQAGAELKRTLGVVGNVIGALIHQNFSADPKGVLTLKPRNAIGNLVHAVRPDSLGPGGPQLKRVAARKCYGRESIGERIRLACIEVVGGPVVVIVRRVLGGIGSSRRPGNSGTSQPGANSRSWKSGRRSSSRKRPESERIER